MPSLANTLAEYLWLSKWVRYSSKWENEENWKYDNTIGRSITNNNKYKGQREGRKCGSDREYIILIPIPSEYPNI